MVFADGTRIVRRICQTVYVVDSSSVTDCLWAHRSIEHFRGLSLIYHSIMIHVPLLDETFQTLDVFSVSHSAM